MIALLLVPAATAAALCAAAWLWAGRYDARPTVRLLASLVATSATIVLLQVLLAFAGALATVPLTIAAWLVALGAIAAWLVRRRAGLPLLGIARPTPLGALLGLLAAGVYAATVGIAAIVPPYGWDSLVYHLTDVFWFAQSGSMSIFGFPAQSLYYPQVGELHSLWGYLLAGSGPDSWRATGVALLPLGLTAAVATRAAAEALGLRAALPWIVPGVLLAPILLTQPIAAYVDGAFAAFVLAAFAFALLAATEGRFAHLALCALACGLALGVKLTFLYFGVPILVVLAGARAWSATVRGSARAIAGRIALCVLLVTIGCGYWLGRNLLRTGNPIYPSRVTLGGETVLHGPKAIEHSKRQEVWFVPSTAAWLRYPFYETFEGRPVYSTENGFGPLFAAGVLATPLAAWLAWRRRRVVLMRALLALPITLLLFLTVQPFREPRYVIAAIGFGWIAIATVAQEIASPGKGRGPSRLLAGAVVAGVVFSAAGGLAFAAPDLPRVLRSWRQGDWRVESYYAIQYGAVGDAFNWLSRNTPEGITVTFTHPAFLAPLFGWHGRNRVVYASTSGDERIGTVERCTTYRGWRHFLYARDVEWIVVWVPWWEGEAPRKADLWIGAHPQDFTLVREFEGRARIYAPVFAPEEARLLESAPPAPGLADLDSPDAWVLEYQEGAQARLTAADSGGVRIDYALQTDRNDYLDARAELDELGLALARTLEFDLEALEPAPALLFVWLKNEDPREACRFRVDLRTLPPGRTRVRLDLRAPEHRSPGFRLDSVRELHVVVDDAQDEATMRGSVRVSGFRLGHDTAATGEVLR